MKSSQQLRKIFKKYDVSAAYLFGSHVGGKTHAKSDVDIAVRYASQPNFSKMLAFANELSIFYKKSADVVNLNTATLQLQFRVYKASAILYAKNPKAEALARAKATSLYHDYRYYFDRFTSFEINRLATKGL